MSNGIVSPVMVSNLITMSICAQYDPRQKVGDPYTIPDLEIRKLRAKLILEEAFETVRALGFDPMLSAESAIDYAISVDPDLEGIIDGCADLNYVLVGTLVSCGVPDEPHFQEVCEANEDKFPEGKATFNASGKFQKPEGWEAPNHKAVEIGVRHIALQDMAKYYLTAFQRIKRGK